MTTKLTDYITQIKEDYKLAGSVRILFRTTDLTRNEKGTFKSSTLSLTGFYKCDGLFVLRPEAVKVNESFLKKINDSEEWQQFSIDLERRNYKGYPYYQMKNMNITHEQVLAMISPKEDTISLSLEQVKYIIDNAEKFSTCSTLKQIESML
jgi:hypothetical protein